MCLRVCSLLAAVLSIIYFIAFGITGSSASATGTTKTLTPSETRQLFGDTIPAKYYDGSSYVDFNFTYATTFTVSSVSADGSTLVSTGDTVLVYSQSGSFNVSTNPSFITVELRPEYSFFDTEFISQYCGLSTSSVPAVSVYSPPSWRWFSSLSGDVIFENQLTGVDTSKYASFVTSMSNTPFTFTEARFDSQSTFSAYSHRVLFYGNSDSNGHLYLAVSCPVVSDDSSMASGTGGVTTGSTASGGDVNVTVDIDLTETNGFLQTIANLLSGLVNGIKNLFIPSQQDILDFKSDLDDLLEEIFGPFWTARSLLRNAMLELDSLEEAESFYFPGISLPLAENVTFDVAPQNVPLNPAPNNSNWSFVLESLRLLVDIVSTIAVFNMLYDKLVMIIHGSREGAE